MTTAHVCFLWHMHQPYYTDPVTGTASMPWVRLHATKAYYDMAALLSCFPSVKATFNFTPSLIRQLNEQAAGTVQDRFLVLAQRPAADLTQEDRAFLLRHFFAANWATMVRPFPRYHELLVKRGTDLHGRNLEQTARQFTAQELLDVQVWHNLTWFGYGALARHPELAALRKKGRGFTEDDKLTVLDIQREVVRDVLPLYRTLQESGQIELTTSPYYHPILPLLISTDTARRARPDLALPRPFRAPEDAAAQLAKAVHLHRDTFGVEPAGLWPSEGSVCPELIPLAKAADLRWLATDEGILARSLQAQQGGWNRAIDLYQPYWVGEPGRDLAIVFRDRDLSDAFGFVYAKAAPGAASENVVHRLDAIVRGAAPAADPVLIPIILDGENPWEHYHDGGEPFLRDLYEALDRRARPAAGENRLVTETIGGALAQRPPVRRLTQLHSGSWINADFKIWIGHQEDNRGWDLLGHVRDRLVHAQAGLTPEQADLAWDALYAAEGSDWFWWYGDDFHTEYKDEFDRLFRTHLRNALVRAGLDVPEDLNRPLFALPEPQPPKQPVELLTPTIDGLVTNFFEWRGAGCIDPSPPLGTMWKASHAFRFIGFGFSLDALFLRLDPDDTALAALSEPALEILVSGAARTNRLIYSLLPHTPETYQLWTASGGDSVAPTWTDGGRYGTVCRKAILELAVPFKDLGLQAGEAFGLTIVLRERGLEIERYPRLEPTALAVPDQDFEARMWKV